MSKLAAITAPDPIGPATTARAAIVDALRTVAQLNVYSTAPDNPSVWDAFPRWALTNYTGGRLAWVAVHEYDVLVVLPGGYEPDTVEQGDTLLDRVVRALQPVGVIQTADPIRVTFTTGTAVPALRIHVVPHPHP